MLRPWDRRHDPAQMDRARELPLAPLHSSKRSADVGLKVTSSDLKDRVHLRVQVPHLCQGISKRDVPEPARNLGLTGTVSKVNREGPTIPPDLPSTVQICASVPAMSRPDDVPPVVPLVENRKNRLRSSRDAR